MKHFRLPKTVETEGIVNDKNLIKTHMANGTAMLTQTKGYLFFETVQIITYAYFCKTPMIMARYALKP